MYKTKDIHRYNNKGDTQMYTTKDIHICSQNNRKYNCTQQRIYTDIYNKGDTHIYTTNDIHKN